MACGLPVVYSATGGVAELVGDEAGVGVPGPLDWNKDHPPAPEALAECILQVVGAREHFSRAARERTVNRFSVDGWLDRHRVVFENLITG
jgi:glycosyltransferase involved in cell wall biosynthesis